MQEISGVYCITNNINNKRYIGLSKNISRRWGEHKRVYKNTNSREYNYPLYNAFRKYGIENFTFEILEECDEELAKEREKYYIKTMNTLKPFGYNMTEGGECTCLKEDGHPCAKLSKEDVVFCREEYAKGSRSKDIYERYFKEKINFSGFQNMWHGRSWKEVMPEVFENNPHKKQKITEEDILDIRTKFLSGVPIMEIDKIYVNKYSHSTISRTINKKDFYPELLPEIEDNHVRLNKKITEDDVRLIKKLKAEGYLHKDIRKALNNKVSMTTISDIVNNKRYSNIK